MNTPIVDFIDSYASKRISRLHMPGHKGAHIIGCEQFDITEINGADDLFHAEGIIAESEANAASLFGTMKTLYSAEGSTLCIKTMLALVRNGDNCVILATRNSHKSLIFGCSQLGIDIDWLFDSSGDFSLCKCCVTPELLDEKLTEYEKLPCAVYVTSPDYLGNMLDIKGLADVAHKYGIPLLVDNAHGAYLHFLDKKIHPMDLGADLCCDSAHKTLPVLTGGAYLHINNEKYCDRAKYMMSMFASSSPSYLILRSLDCANAILADDFHVRLDYCVKKLDSLRQSLDFAIDSDPLKLTVRGRYAEKMRSYGIECEYQDPDFTVMMFSPYNNDDVFDDVARFFRENRVEYAICNLTMPVPEKKLCVRDAVLGDYEVVCVENAEGRICAAPSVSCPPAIPVVVSGEIISREAVDIFRYYNIDKCMVLK